MINDWRCFFYRGSQKMCIQYGFVCVFSNRNVSYLWFSPSLFFHILSQNSWAFISTCFYVTMWLYWPSTFIFRVHQASEGFSHKLTNLGQRRVRWAQDIKYYLSPKFCMRWLGSFRNILLRRQHGAIEAFSGLCSYDSFW